MEVMAMGGTSDGRWVAWVGQKATEGMPDWKVMVDLVEYDGGCRDTVGDGGYEQHYQAASCIFFFVFF